jgi:hypothetical protein
VNPLQRFLEYAAAFEQTYADDDWTRLERFFAPDAIYRVTGGNEWDCEVKGCKSVLAAMRKFVDEFDRHCTRRISATGAPVVTADTVRVPGRAVYTRGDSDELVLEIALLAEYRDGVIATMTDIHAPENAPRTHAWLQKWGEGLDPSYV